MNRRQRRAQGKAAQRKALVDGLEQIRQEGQGVWQMAIYGPEAVPGLVNNALCGDGYARNVVRTLAHMAREIITAPAALPMLCLCCDNALTAEAMPAAWVLLHARRDDPEQAVGNGICAECYARHPSAEALGPIVTDVYRRQIISDLRVLPPVSESGHG